jgi:hypothetical protein
MLTIVTIACSFGWWLVLICSERKILLAGCWFVLRQKHCWLVADKPNEREHEDIPWLRILPSALHTDDGEAMHVDRTSMMDQDQMVS